MIVRIFNSDGQILKKDGDSPEINFLTSMINHEKERDVSQRRNGASSVFVKMPCTDHGNTREAAILSVNAKQDIFDSS